LPIPTPFHSRTAPLCESQEWRNWAGYLAAAIYEPGHDREYYAIRNSAALIDVSPLFKYELRGPDAVTALDRILTRDVKRCSIGQVMYTPWCDDAGKVIDDGTLARLDDARFRLTAAEANLAWFQDCSYGLDVQVRDVSQELATLAVQGPFSRLVLEKVLGASRLAGLKYYHIAEYNFAGIPLSISRTGYTGDLGYELWLSPEHAGKVWDTVMEAGEGIGALPAGIMALDIARVEAGLVMQQVDYISVRKARIPDQESSPYEIGLGWAVNLEKANFIGKKALAAEKKAGSKWRFVGLEVEWDPLEALFGRVDLTPQLAGRASRSAIPVYRKDRHIGQMTSHTFSPILKKYIAIGTIESSHAHNGDEVELEFTVEYVRHKSKARIVKPPFYDPPRKRG
jgi:aminomethyltransferase